MRSAGNFHPEWGYLAPAPSFMRTVRIALVATAIGATAGAVVVVSLVERPGSNDDNNSIAAHALVTSAPVIASPAAAGPAKTVVAAKPSQTAQQQTSQMTAVMSAPAITPSAKPSAGATASKPDVARPTVAAISAPPAALASAETSASVDRTPASADTDAAAADAAAVKKFANKKRHYEVPRRWQSANAKKRWRDNRGFAPLLRLFSFRTGSPYSSN